MNNRARIVKHTEASVDLPATCGAEDISSPDTAPALYSVTSNCQSYKSAFPYRFYVSHPKLYPKYGTYFHTLSPFDSSIALCLVGFPSQPFSFFFLNNPAPPEIYPLPLPAAFPI